MGQLNVNVNDTVKFRESLGSGEEATNSLGKINVEDIAIRMYRDLGRPFIVELVAQFNRLLNEE